MKFKIFILILVLLGLSFLTKVFLSDFFINKYEVHIMDKYFVLEVNGEYNLMERRENGYGLIVPSILSVYIKGEDIITSSNLDGSKFINSNYKSNNINSENKYYYKVRQFEVQEMSEQKFEDSKKEYILKWSPARAR